MKMVRSNVNDLDKVYICGFDKYADNNLYVTEAHLVDLCDAFVTAIPMLLKHDNVSIVSTEDYAVLEHDYATLCKYSINLWRGAEG